MQALKSDFERSCYLAWITHALPLSWHCRLYESLLHKCLDHIVYCINLFVFLVLQCDPIVEAIRSLNRNVNSGFLHDEFGGSSASSDDSAADRTFEINCIQLDSPESPVNRRTIRPQYRPTSHNFVAQGTAPRRVFLIRNLQEEAHQGKVRSSTVKQEGKPNSIKVRLIFSLPISLWTE